MRTIARRTAIVVAALIPLAACTPGDVGGKTKLTIATFGEFGYAPLIAEYEKLHPDITVQNRVTDFDTHHKGLATQLATGHGAADVVAIEEQYMPQYRKAKDKFADLAGYGARELEKQWVPWKWAQGTDGAFVLGLGTDMGSLALCYRRDLFQAADLPTGREEVAKLMPDWDAYAATAERFTAKTPNVKFADSAGTVYTAMLNQSPENYFSQRDDSFIADRNPSVRAAFFLSGGLAAKGQTAAATTFTQAWNVAIKQGSFATVACPAWMLSQIKEAGGEANRGKWDVTTVPGKSGNQGGSFLTVPKQGAHQKEAYELARWLTAPEQQKKLFLSDGILPSEPAVYEDPEVLAHSDPYFGEAPTGRIFAASADQLRPNYRGLRDADVRPEFGRALGRIEERTDTVDQAWTKAVQQAQAALK
ncbi:sugar ABC transporter periplasmic protein [Amycolatopsis mediterranei S699]|uniref:Periplasmic substrate-binding component of ABC-type sugar/cellobiose transport system n=2 Tax=Amycolatopsis mediterranei TaxID=33910 RepID=A0A0H3DGJ6_AMYMU|nr:extracellular solute-binding protein [Amycolatopsis mediterranei]ADJ49826.1 periplasmic substrate-binding component of ABC-type sugar/cellobiose transport system [Amycolatopsis mediterranei U32]AEK46814.1 sugar ABC transporter periplasmic protein [Amycolatopsis mediterranei S699]AFO81534.1 sugar ABC transporter periplasmic protein [Amycolatopsis mediterranei S699]AGT88663.1 sugar ABC transporter periplasmic protein [Amycolatopsis mediterranei RB]KDO07924.1 sugar ABC transporter substrate-bi